MACVLIVDDDGASRHTMSVILRSAGHEILEANGGAAALAQLGETLPDVVVTDIVMSGMSGIELIQVLAREYPGIGIVAVSGGGGYVDAEHYLSVCRVYKVSAALAKPFLPQVLIDAVGDALQEDSCSSRK